MRLLVPLTLHAPGPIEEVGSGEARGQVEATEEGWKDLSLSHEQFKQAHGRHFAAAKEEKPRPEPPRAERRPSSVISSVGCAMLFRLASAPVDHLEQCRLRTKS